jgi:hypothetical protein
MKNPPLPKLPVILYEEPLPGEDPNPIPYIEVKLDVAMEPVLFISEYKETGEFEIDPEHGSVPIVDMLIHAYASLDRLKTVLDADRFDEVRIALGMKPLQVAMDEGQKILDKVSNNAEVHAGHLKEDSPQRAARTFSLGEDFRQKANRFLKNKDEDKDN